MSLFQYKKYINGRIRIFLPCQPSSRLAGFSLFPPRVTLKNEHKKTRDDKALSCKAKRAVGKRYRSRSAATGTQKIIFNPASLAQLPRSVGAGPD
jgi:hypothetical protein